MVTFDEARNAFVVKIDMRANGKRTRLREILPVGINLDEAQKYERKLLGEKGKSLIDRLKEQLEVLAPTEQSAGFIYAIYNSSLPNLIKIGMTKRSVKARISGMKTGTPGEWRVIQSAYVSHAGQAERLLHEHFKESRVNDRREFFAISALAAQTAIRICQSVLVPHEDIADAADRYANNTCIWASN